MLTNFLQINTSPILFIISVHSFPVSGNWSILETITWTREVVCNYSSVLVVCIAVYPEHPVALVGVSAVQGMPDQDLYDSQESVEDSK